MRFMMMIKGNEDFVHGRMRDSPDVGV